MPNQDKTEIICILDRSGSMDTIRDDAIGGFNAFLEEQKQVPGEATLSMQLFDDQFLTIHSSTPLKDVPKLDPSTYVPRGGTALLDAIGRTINEVEARILGMPDEEQPAKVLVLILTDGMENASQEFNKGRIEKIIKDHEAKGWEFMYLKAGSDAFEEAGSIGISQRNYANVGASAKGMRHAYRGVSDMAASYRISGQAAVQGMSLQASADDEAGNLTPDVLVAARASSGLSGTVDPGITQGPNVKDGVAEAMKAIDEEYGDAMQKMADTGEDDDA